jgi:hypothetical protein
MPQIVLEETESILWMWPAMMGEMAYTGGGRSRIEFWGGWGGGASFLVIPGVVLTSPTVVLPRVLIHLKFKSQFLSMTYTL